MSPSRRRGPARCSWPRSRAGHWKVVARTTSKRTGVFTFGVPAGKKTGTRVFRAQAGAARGLPAVHTRSVKVKITAKAGSTGPTIPAGADYDAAEALPNGYDPPGAKNDWSSLFGASSVRWDPCTVIRWRYDDNGQAYNALPDVTRAIARIAGVSGLRFKYMGASSFRYLGQKDPTFPANADLFVSWASADEYSAPQGQGLDGPVVGVGGGYATSAGADALGVDWRMSDGYLTLDKGAGQVARGFDGSGWGQIMMHETLHAMGLGHAQDTRDSQDHPTSREVMAPIATDLNYQFGAGDITGMHHIGLHSSDDCG